MQTLSSPSSPPKRSRSGCFTCKVRKVKCDAAHKTAKPSKATPEDCLNCKRLGFECRWKAPADGEAYAPPPKRRRTAVQRHAARIEDLTFDVGAGKTLETGPGQLQNRQERPGGSTGISSVADPPEYIPQATESNDQPADMYSITETGLSSVDEESNLFDLTSMDSNLAIEGLDFIPVPFIDTSALSLYTDTFESNALPQWSPINPDDLWQQPTASPSRDRPSSPSTNIDNRRLVQHYLSVVKGYSKVDDPAKNADNLFISAFTQSLCFPPLFHAILAFSAAHMSIQDPSHSQQAIELDHVAQRSINSFRQEHSIEVEGLLSALFVRAKKMHVVGDSIESFLTVMTEAAEVISTEHGEKALKDSSTLARSVIIRMAILDARAGCFRLGGGVLISRLRSMLFLPDCFDTDRPPDVCASLGPLASLLRANIFRFQVGELDVRLHKQMQSEFLAIPPLQTSEFVSLQAKIRSEIAWWERRLQTYGVEPHGSPVRNHEALDSRIFSCYIVLSALHGAALYLDRIFPVPPYDRTLSATAVLQYQLQVCHDSSRRDTPSSILPSSLFVAALSTPDPIHRDWVLETLRKGEKWGLYVRKMRVLLESMYEGQNAETEGDICHAMDHTTGRFLM